MSATEQPELAVAADDQWIQTYTGKAFWPLNPRVQDVCIEDIAHALSMKCRFTGHCRKFYSVAEHSVLASVYVPARDALWALLHDAGEAYLPDVARPIKQAMPELRKIEDRIIEVIAGKFGLSLPMPDSIHEIDLILLATEQRDLMCAPPYRWTAIEGCESWQGEIDGWEPIDAERRFLRQFEYLCLRKWTQN